MSNDNDTDTCLPCKITSVCCLTAIGGYLIFQGRQPPKNKLHLLFMGIGCIGLGIGEIFDKSPFRNNKEEKSKLE